MPPEKERPLKLAVAGAGGRMGRMLIKAVLAHPDCQLVAAIDRPGSEVQGADAGTLAGMTPVGIAVDSDVGAALELAEGLLDFTAPEASLTFAKETANRGSIHVIGTTGFSADQEETLASISKGARVVKAGNFSLGVNLLMVLTKQAAMALGPDYDIEITETHHRHKVDAPSGTALMLGEAAAAGRKLDLAENSERGRDGITGAKKERAIGFSSVRTGEVIGEHTVIFGGPTERLELKHIASDRSLFADGALRAACWAQYQKPGLYSMMDVLGL